MTVDKAPNPSSPKVTVVKPVLNEAQILPYAEYNATEQPHD